MSKIFKRKCVSCNENAFSYFDLFKMIDGMTTICKSCKKKFKGKEPWIFLFQILIGLIPIVLVLSIIYFGFLFGLIFLIISFLLVTGLIAYQMPFKRVEVQPKTDDIDNLEKAKEP